MDDGQERPRAGDPPQLTAPIDILRELLSVERDRLPVALRIEKERSIVFPETTVIIRDIERLTLEIEKRELQPEPKEDGPGVSALERAAERARAKGFV